MSSKFSIFTVVLLAIQIITGVAKAENPGNLSNNIFLAEKPNVQFKSFMNKNAKRFVRRNNTGWLTFNKTVSLYHESQGQFAKMDTEEQLDFYAASASIKNKLEKMRGTDSKEWLEKVKVTEKIFAFLWSNKLPVRPLEGLNIQVPRAETVISR